MIAELGEAAARVGFAAAVALAWRCSTPDRSPHFRPAAWALSAAFLADLARTALRLLVLAPARAAGRLPYVGAERAAFHLEELLWLLFPALSVALALHVFLGRRAGPVWAALGATWSVLALGYPTIRGELLLRVYLVVHLAALAVQLALGALFFVRRGLPGLGQRVALALLCSDIAALVGPWWAGDPVREWYTVRWPSALVWLVVSAYEWRASRWNATHARNVAAPPDG